MKKHVITIFLILIVITAGFLAYWVLTKPDQVDEFVFVKPISKKTLKLHAGVHEVNLKVNDAKYGELERLFIVYIPQNFNTENQYPLLFVLHGTGGTAKEILKNSGFNDLADQENFIVVYPQALGLGDTSGADFRNILVNKESSQTAWNTGKGEGYGTINEVDDLAFFELMIGMFSKLNVINQDSIFITGISNGGDMTQKVIANFPDVFIGAGLVSSGLEFSDSDLEGYQPTPLVIFHGTNDDFIPYDGDDKIVSTPDKVDYLAQLNGCSNQSEIKNVQADDLEVEIKTYLTCEKPVKFYTVFIGEHKWYAHETPALWEFFKEQSI